MITTTTLVDDALDVVVLNTATTIGFVLFVLPLATKYYFNYHKAIKRPLTNVHRTKFITCLLKARSLALFVQVSLS